MIQSSSISEIDLLPSISLLLTAYGLDTSIILAEPSLIDVLALDNKRITIGNTRYNHKISNKKPK